MGAPGGLLGSTEPRLWTPPLRPLTEETSYGFAVVAFARDVLGMPLDPWEEWLVIHAGEMLEDGRPRFRTLLVLVARQNGKTHLLTVLALFWLFVERWPLVLGVSTLLDYAKEAWDAAVQFALDTPELAEQLPVGRPSAVKEGNNDVRLLTSHGTRYKIAAANRRAGRSLRIDRLIVDEVREHQTRAVWNAAFNAMNARPFGQCWAISNQGDDTAIILNELRTSALGFLETGEGDQRLGLFEWSAPLGCEVDDPRALAQANPNAGRRLHWDDLLGPARRAKKAGGEAEADFRVEVLCQAVPKLRPAIDPDAWRAAYELGDLAAVRSRVAVVLEVAPDQQHVTLYAAAVLPDGRARVDFVKAWDGPGCGDRAQRELPALLERVKPRAFGWLPNGPTAALAAALADLRAKGRHGWPPPGVTVEEIRGDVPAVCMGFAQAVVAGQVVHSGDPLLDSQVAGAEQLPRGDAWVFSRRGDGHVDAVYAAAAAVHLARTLPTSAGKPRVLVAR
ncbi:terminase [Asanoa siamensis]|uniref:Terminase n=1 Tax=Asanoa siamensis TaxID=926357 RepID=A0ABQ4CM47_9ACTN|nr:terminase [Asanoa siamensis]GIF71902.1 hypothetical protein Asi02nite_14200 [Asanoa siamensis]